MREESNRLSPGPAGNRTEPYAKPTLGGPILSRLTAEILSRGEVVTGRFSFVLRSGASNEVRTCERAPVQPAPGNLKLYEKPIASEGAPAQQRGREELIERACVILAGAWGLGDAVRSRSQ